MKIKSLITKIAALGCVVALLLCGCGGTSSETTASNGGDETTTAGSEETTTASGAEVKGDKSSHEEDGTDPIHLAFVLYNWTDDQGTYCESYLNYLAENMNIEVECVSYSNSVEDMIDVIESLCSKGVDAIAVATDNGFQSWAQICEDNEVYCSIFLGRLSDDDDKEFAAGLDYYLGSVGREDYTFLGEEYADYIEEQGFENVLIAAPSEGLQDQADQMVAGSTAALDKAGVTYDLVRTAWSDMFSSVASKVASNTYDAIYCPLSVMSFGLPQVYSNNLVGQTVVMGHGTDESMSDVFGSVVAVFSDNLTTSVGANVAMMINAVEGNEYPDTPTDTYINIEAPAFFIDSEEDFETYSTYIRNYEDPVYYISADLVKDWIMSYNGSATFDDIDSYISELTIDNVADMKK